MMINEKYILELEYENYKFVKIHASNDNPGCIFIKESAYFIGWIGKEGLIPGSGMMKIYGNTWYVIIGIDCLE